MRHYLSKPSVTLGTMLLMGTLCAEAQSQAPQPNPTRPMPIAGAAAGPSMGMPQTYAPPMMTQGAFGLSAMPGPYGAPGTTVASEFLSPQAPAQLPPAQLPAAQAPPAVNPPAPQDPESWRSRIGLGNLLKKRTPENPPTPTAVAPPYPTTQAAGALSATAPQQQPRPAAQPAVSMPPQMIATGAVPAANAAAQLVAGQIPAGTQGPVIICMPAGWQPPTEFAPRQVTPEVSEEFWPVTNRNPLGGSEPAGMFRWPKLAREAGSETPVSREPAKALVTNATLPASPKPAPSAQPPVDTTPPWKKILMAKSHEAPTTVAGADAASSVVEAPPSNSKALFSLSRKKQPVAAPVVATRPVAPSPVAVHVAQAPAAAASNPARAPAPPVVAKREPTGSRIRTTVPEAPARLVADSSNPKLQWRAKGAPKTSPPDDASGSADAGPQVAVHTEPAAPARGGGPTPADPALDPAIGGELPPSAPVLEYVPPHEVIVDPPCPATRRGPAPAPKPTARNKSLLPASIWREPVTPVSATPPEPALKLTSGRQTGARALMNIAPTRPTPQPTPEPYAQGAVATTAPPSAAASKALLPKMFVEYAASEISLSTKPTAAAPPIGMPTPVMVAAAPVPAAEEPEAADALDSYYAPTPPVVKQAATSNRKHAPPKRKQPTPAQSREPEVPGYVKRSSPHPREYQPAEQQQGYAPPREIPPLARPFWAISELTKLPKFMTALTGGGASAQVPTSYTTARPRPVQGPTEAVAPPAQADEFSDADNEAIMAAVDEQAARPSKRRQPRQADDESMEEEPTAEEPADEEEAGEEGEPREPGKSRPRAKTSLAQHEQSVDEESPATDEELEPDDNRPIRKPAAKTPSGAPARAKAAVKVVSKKESGGAPISRSKAVRMRKKDGSTVIVYYAANSSPTKQQAAPETEQFEQEETQTANPPGPVRRQVIRQSASNGKVRENPLR